MVLACFRRPLIITGTVVLVQRQFGKAVCDKGYDFYVLIFFVADLAMPYFLEGTITMHIIDEHPFHTHIHASASSTYSREKIGAL